MTNDQLILNELKSINKRLDQLENGQKDLQNSQKDIRETMATKDDIKAIKITQQEQRTDTKIIKEDIKTLELKVALIHDQNNKDHMKIIDIICAGWIRSCRNRDALIVGTATSIDGKLAQHPAVSDVVIDHNRVAIVIVSTWTG